MSATGGLRHVSCQDVPVHRASREETTVSCRAFRGQNFDAFVAQDIIERMLVIGRASEPKEWMGLLMGHLCEDDAGTYVVARQVIHDSDALARPGFIESTHESEARTRRLGRVLFPDLVCLGWAHGHVRCGVFFSSQDFQTQASWTSEYALGVVVDPWDPREIAVFRGPGGERLEATQAVKPTLEVEHGGRVPHDEPKPPSTNKTSARGIVRFVLASVGAAIGISLIVAVVLLGVLLQSTRARVRALEEQRNAASIESTE